MTDAVSLAIERYGYAAVAVGIGAESFGLPVPGEVTLVSAAAYAAATGRLDLPLVIAAAVFGGVIGDAAGYWLGRCFGPPLLARFGPALRLTPARIRLGRYLFLRHGGAVVFFGRFVAVLRALSAVLAGTNLMPWRRFLAFNVAGGVCWATTYGLAAFALGRHARTVLHPAGLILMAVAVAAMATVAVLLRRAEARLTREADLAQPDRQAQAGC